MEAAKKFCEQFRDLKLDPTVIKVAMLEGAAIAIGVVNSIADHLDKPEDESVT